MPENDDDDGITMRRGYQAGGRLVPIPDPTALTTKLVREAVDALRAELETRFIAIDKTADLVQAALDREIMHLRELIEARIEKITQVSNERLNAIAIQFTERDKRVVDGAKAIDIALQTVKESTTDQNRSRDQAIAKSESSTKEALGQLRTFVDINISGLNDKVNDLKTRIDRGEGKTSVSDPAVADAVRQLGAVVTNLSAANNTGVGHSSGLNAAWGFIVGGIGVLVGIAGLFELARGGIHP